MSPILPLRNVGAQRDEQLSKSFYNSLCPYTIGLSQLPHHFLYFTQDLA